MKQVLWVALGAALMFAILSYFYSACADPSDLANPHLIVHSTPKGSGPQGCDTYELKEVKDDRLKRQGN